MDIPNFHIEMLETVISDISSDVQVLPVPGVPVIKILGRDRSSLVAIFFFFFFFFLAQLKLFGV